MDPVRNDYSTGNRTFELIACLLVGLLDLVEVALQFDANEKLGTIISTKEKSM
jgi:hypothetical protein